MLKEKLPDTTLTRPVYPVLAGAVAAADMNIGQTRTDEQYEKIFEQITIVS
ncbi:hypothetical protein JCM19037_2112 [Geomicrobium sp. JCM 19037]|uniref:hypothetical protein n=1 Tax=Geomicrobium sp. JCM 19037 TaxID=1460634 RepID=UPI00045F3A0D|nr:hypothetical protein [Geomicrobium sp. JCM 19037]GAK03766.1 hypothetical protein JCM19037_2112 [Geomicrobium sp. JCM 19037]